MKKTQMCFSLILFMFFYHAVLQAQTFTLYTEIGVKSTIGGLVLNNDNIRKDIQITERRTSLHYAYGGKFSLNYLGTVPKRTIFGLHADYIFAKATKEYPLLVYNGTDYYSKSIDYTLNTIAILFRYTIAGYRLYLEAGPQFSYFSSVKESNSINSSDFLNSNPEYDLSSNYVSYQSYVFGLGIHYRFASFGLKISNSIGSVMKTAYHPLTDGFYNNLVNNPSYNTAYFNEVATTAFIYEFSIDFNIPFISMGRASCGSKAFSIFRSVNERYYWGSNW